MPKNSDGSVTIKTPGKVAQPAKGGGTGKVTPAAATGVPSGTPSSGGASSLVVPVKGKGPTSKTQGDAGKAAGKPR